MPGNYLTNSISSRLGHLVILTLVLLSSGLSLAKLSTPESCESVDLRAQLGPVRDQGNVGWCYANTAADLLTAKYNTKDMGVMSAFQLAMIFNYNSEKSLTAEGGSVHDTLKYALRARFPGDREDQLLKFGFCPRGLSLNPKTSLKTMLSEMTLLKSTYDAGKVDPVQSRVFRGQQIRAQMAGYIPAQISEGEFFRLLDTSTPRSFLLRYANLICGPQKLFNGSLNTEVITLDRANPRQLNLIDTLTTQIQDGNVVGIDFNLELIQAGGQLEHLAPNNLHAVSVIGQRWRHGSCQFLLRNSWGKACELKNQKGEYVSRYSQYVEECDGGNLWVSEKNLDRALQRLTFISNAPASETSPTR